MKYFIDGENQLFDRLSDVRHHCWLLNNKDGETIVGSSVVRTKGDESEVIGYIRFVNGKCVISKR